MFVSFLNENIAITSKLICLPESLPLQIIGKNYLSKIELPYDPAIPLLDIFLEKTKMLIQKDTCTLMFIAALFTIPKTWKQPKCPSTDELRRCDYLSINKMEYYSAIKRMKYCQTEKDKYYMISLICGI